jgi:hypothetical protein
MAVSHDPNLQIYVAKRDIPIYQRDAIWGLAVLGVFICGLLVGWLMLPAPVQNTARQSSALVTDNQVLAEQDEINRTLGESIAQLEAVLAGDVCGAEAMTRVTAISESPATRR